MSTDLAGLEGVARSAVLQAVVESGRSGLTSDRLRKELGRRFSASEIDAALGALEGAGEAAEWNGRWLAVSETDWITGHVHRLERGDAVLRSGFGGEASYFIPRRQLKGAGDGDLILARRNRKRNRQQKAHRLPEATVLKVLTPAASRLVGVITRSHGVSSFTPFDARLALSVRLDGAEGVADGTYVVLEIDRERSPGSAVVPGVVCEELGPITEVGVDILATLRHFEIPDEFPPAVDSAAGLLPTNPEPGSWADREDLREHTLLTIDGESARDFDDAISLDGRAGGGFILGVHIADVSHYVAEGSALDLEAYRRGTSVYFPDRAVPMLPERLSNGLCSLRPGVPRLALSAFLEITPHGKVIGRRFARTVIESKRRLTYSEVRRLLEEPSAGDAEAYGDVLPTLKMAQKLMRKLLKRRKERGSIDFDLPEGDVILDLDGVAIGVRPGERNVAHRIIEEFMIAANEAVALELEGREQPALFRIHDQPDPMRLRELQELLSPLGIALELDGESVHPRLLQSVMRRIEGHSSEPFVASLVLRSMKRARYDPECKGHYALSSRHYTHFTSPIRRYPDLLVHRQLKAELRAESGEESVAQELLEARLPTIAEHTSATEARAERAERLVLQWKVIRMLAEREGEEFAARVTGVKPYGMFLQLSDFYVDGLLPLANLRGDFYEYRAESHELVGRKGRTFRLADEVTVVLEEIDLVRRRLLLGLAESPERRDRIER